MLLVGYLALSGQGHGHCCIDKLLLLLLLSNFTLAFRIQLCTCASVRLVTHMAFSTAHVTMCGLSTASYVLLKGFCSAGSMGCEWLC